MRNERMDLLNSISANTINYRLKDWIDNFKANLPAVVGGYGVSSLQDTLKGVPAIIVGSGPTLDRNIRELQHLQNRAVIIACDSVVKPLLEFNVKPHIILSTDSKGKVKDFFKGLDTKQFNFVIDTFSHPSCHEAIEGRIYWYNTLPVEQCPFTNMLNSWTGYIGNIGTGGCVATTIWCFAVMNLACDPDILVGLPQGFYDPAFQYSPLVIKHNGDVIDQYTSPPVQDTDIFNQPVWTHPAFQSFTYWFQDAFVHLPGIHINCSEGGIIKENILNMSLRACADKYLHQEYDIESLLFQKEAVAGEIMTHIDNPPASWKPLFTLLIDGPSLPNLAVRMGLQLQDVSPLIEQLRAAGLNISETTTIVETPEGTESLPVFKLEGVNIPQPTVVPVEAVPGEIPKE